MKSSKEMPYHFAISGRIYLNYHAQQIVAVNDSIYRKVYNILVAANEEKYRLKQYADVIPTYKDRIDFLNTLTSSATNIKNMYPYMYGELVDADAITNAITNYKAGWNSFVKVPNTGKPTFHKKKYEQSYNTSTHYKNHQKGIKEGSIRFINKKKIHLPIIGDVRFKGSSKLINRIFDIENSNSEIRITTVTISRDAVGRYFCTLLIASDEPLYKKKNIFNNIDTAVGIDVNLTNLCTTSDNEVFDNIKVRKNFKKKLAKKQHKASKRLHKAKTQNKDVYQSKNYQKARKEVSLLQSKNAKHEDNYLHSIAKKIVNNHDYIFVEDLKIKNLLKNHKLAYAISDVCWGKFFSILEKEANKQSKVFIKVPPKNTTQTCSICKHVCVGDEHIKLGIEKWICPNCGELRIRDHNSAENIKQRGLMLLSA
ncbi:MAG: transposase [Acutalibacteraceae bacterium]|nr:transposase [Acutalibacteraceae bacterium]